MRKVLFLCTHNAGRSQMAQALFNHMAAGRAHALSAGTHPASQVDPSVLQVMREIGLDLSTARPKPLTDVPLQKGVERLITMGCDVACPTVPGLPTEDWGLEDPAGQPLEKVRAIRDQVILRVQRLLQEMGIEPRPLPLPRPSAHSG